MSSLEEKKCIPCEGGLDAMNEARAKEFQEHTPNWQIIDDNKKIYREFKFKNFRQALAFVNQAGEIAEGEGHHPDIELGWGYVNITIQTHAINGLHENDFILAVKIDKILSE